MDVQLQIPDDVARIQVHAFLKAHNIDLHYPMGELENDLASLKHFEEILTE